ncbi:MAG TPA: hypothetical protein VN426_02440 [Syntrophomonadaceae bacterium]|nr:hypothetical protein [Syntrophomonadaceae bacterium]
MAALANDSLEYILVHTPQLQGIYAGLGGTFATLVDGCLRKNILPGFYENGMIKRAELKDNKLVLVLSEKKTDADLLSLLDVAIRNVGGFPSQNQAADAWMVEVNCEIEK